MTSWRSELAGILRDTLVEWFEDGVPERGAALAYYMLLSLGPLLVLIVGALEFFLASDVAREGLTDAIGRVVGVRAADTFQTVLEQAEVPDLMAPESILTFGLLLFGATAVFVNVRGSLNKIWGLGAPNPSKTEIVLDFLKGRLRGIAMIVLTGGVVALWFIVTSAASLFASSIGTDDGSGALFLRAIDAALAFLFIGVLFAAIYRTLPATRIEPGDVVVGALATAMLFLAGKSLVAWLISSADWTSYYGPGASVVAFLAWIYFSAQLFFLGAEFTWVWARRRRARRAATATSTSGPMGPSLSAAGEAPRSRRTP